MKRKSVGPVFAVVTMVAIVVVALVAAGPTIYQAFFQAPAYKTAPLDATGAKPASTDLDGHWIVVHPNGRNKTQVGFTFKEILPGKRLTTSGSTVQVEGDAVIKNATLSEGQVTVQTDHIRTNVQQRDINVRMKILNTDKYPTAGFTITGTADLSHIPQDGTPGHVTVPGQLTLHGTTKAMDVDFTVLRTGDRIVLDATIPVHREDFHVKTPEFVAAKIAEDGELNIRLNLEKQK